MTRMRRVRSDDAGFGLVELVVALTILSIVMAGVAHGVLSQLTLTADSRGREVATNLASQSIDAARAVSDLSTLTALETVQNVNGVAYTVLRTVTDYSSSAASPCDGSQVTAIIYKRISIRVTWPNMVAQPVTASTLLAPSAASFNPATGNIGVKVVNAASLPVYGALVTLVNGGSSLANYTDDNGCAFFDTLAPGSYTVSATYAGFVAPDGTATPSQTPVVNSGVTTRVAFSLDQAASIRATLPSGTYPAPASVPLTIGNSSLIPSGAQLEPGSGVSRVISNLYPFPSGYTIWSGSCSDADPEAQIMVNGVGTGPYYPGATRGSSVSVTSGSGSANLVMALVSVKVNNSAGIGVAGDQVVATHVTTSGAPDQGCPTPEVWNIGSTDANGNLSASLPWGDWQFSAAGVTTPVTTVLAPAPTAYNVALATP